MKELIIDYFKAAITLAVIYVLYAGACVLS